jgi:sulfite reductase (NADPH) flavoprotein alpha-component
MEAVSPYDRRHPFEATLLARRPLCRGETEREAYHLVIDIRGSRWRYSCGDSLAILPKNDPEGVSELLQKLSLEPSTLVTLPSSGIFKPLREVLEEELCLSRLPKSFWEFLRQRVERNEAWRKIPVGESEEWGNFIENHTLAKAVELFPDFRCTAQELVEHLRPLSPRLYSIASAPTLFPEEIHLAVVRVKYEDIYGEKRHGVATRYLSPQGIPVGGRFRCFLVSSHFRLPEDIRHDLILVGPGTGVAPFRAFIWEYAARREAGRETGRIWLFFGSLYRHSHFYYQEEWEELMARGVLTHLDCAFSRDQAEKIYVQHRLLERGPELAQWILGGAHFYVCGDATHMARDVEAALLQILSAHAGLPDPGDYLRAMRREKRYQKDVY